jgi:hypothetical protein
VTAGLLSGPRPACTARRERQHGASRDGRPGHLRGNAERAQQQHCGPSRQLLLPSKARRSRLPLSRLTSLCSAGLRPSSGGVRTDGGWEAARCGPAAAAGSRDWRLTRGGRGVAAGQPALQYASVRVYRGAVWTPGAQRALGILRIKDPALALLTRHAPRPAPHGGKARGGANRAPRNPLTFPIYIRRFREISPSVTAPLLCRATGAAGEGALADECLRRASMPARVCGTGSEESAPSPTFVARVAASPLRPLRYAPA